MARIMTSGLYNKNLLEKRLGKLEKMKDSLTADILKTTELKNVLGSMIACARINAMVKVSDYTYAKSSMNTLEHVVKRGTNRTLSSFQQTQAYLHLVIRDLEGRRRRCMVQIDQIRERLIVMEENLVQTMEQVERNHYRIQHGNFVEIIEVDSEPYVRKPRVAHRPIPGNHDGKPSTKPADHAKN